MAPGWVSEQWQPLWFHRWRGAMASQHQRMGHASSWVLGAGLQHRGRDSTCPRGWWGGDGKTDSRQPGQLRTSLGAAVRVLHGGEAGGSSPFPPGAALGWRTSWLRGSASYTSQCSHPWILSASESLLLFSEQSSPGLFSLVCCAGCFHVGGEHGAPGPPPLLLCIQRNHALFLLLYFSKHNNKSWKSFQISTSKAA